MRQSARADVRSRNWSAPAASGDHGTSTDALTTPPRDARQVRRTLTRLADLGLVIERDGRWVACAATFAAALRSTSHAVDADELPPQVWRDGRVAWIPRQTALRQRLLGRLLEDFEPGRTYTEVEVNDLLRSRHDDTATLRRNLVDSGLLGRDPHGTVYSVARDTG